MTKPTVSRKKLGPGTTALDRELRSRGITNNIELAHASGYDCGYIRGFGIREPTRAFKGAITRAARQVLNDPSIRQRTLFPRGGLSLMEFIDPPRKKFQRLAHSEYAALEAMIDRDRGGLRIERRRPLSVPPMRLTPSTPNP